VLSVKNGAPDELDDLFGISQFSVGLVYAESEAAPSRCSAVPPQGWAGGCGSEALLGTSENANTGQNSSADTDLLSLERTVFEASHPSLDRSVPSPKLAATARSKDVELGHMGTFGSNLVHADCS
jgi:hypothetical protein